LLPCVDSIRGACCRFCSGSAMLTVSSSRNFFHFSLSEIEADEYDIDVQFLTDSGQHKCTSASPLIRCVGCLPVVYALSKM